MVRERLMLLIFMGICLLVPSAYADTVAVKTGVAFNGDIIEKTDDYVVIVEKATGIKRKIDYKYILDVTDDDLVGGSIEQNSPQSALMENYKMRHDFQESIKHMFLEKKFEELDKIIEGLRISQERFPSGEWKLKIFYMGILESLGNSPSLQQQSKIIEILDEWYKKRPQSITPKIVLVRAYLELAWIYRGEGTSKTVDIKKQISFQHYLERSWEIALENQKLEAHDPYIFEGALWTAVGLSFEKEQLYELVQKGAMINPEYDPLYVKLSPAFLPRWFGDKTDAENFADWSAQQVGSDAMYSRVAARIFEYA